jgi:EAL domain-containing protein (putative c-di-GMP-specific phosphodiesterase class I)
VLTWSSDKQTLLAPRPIPRCSVNLSADTVRRDRDFGDYVLQGLRETGVPAASLSFEIPVSDALADPQSLARLTWPLRSAGCSFALSGFRGEEAALELASSLGIAFIKVDGSFASLVTLDPEAEVTLRGIVQRCRKLGMHTVCVQVETAEAFERLRTIQADYAQGFVIDRPRVLQPSVNSPSATDPVSLGPDHSAGMSKGNHFLSFRG